MVSWGKSLWVVWGNFLSNPWGNFISNPCGNFLRILCANSLMNPWGNSLRNPNGNSLKVLWGNFYMNESFSYETCGRTLERIPTVIFERIPGELSGGSSEKKINSWKSPWTSFWTYRKEYLDVPCRHFWKNLWRNYWGIDLLNKFPQTSLKKISEEFLKKNPWKNKN